MYSYDENVYGIGGMDEKELATQNNIETLMSYVSDGKEQVQGRRFIDAADPEPVTEVHENATAEPKAIPLTQMTLQVGVLVETIQLRKLDEIQM